MELDENGNVVPGTEEQPTEATPAQEESPAPLPEERSQEATPSESQPEEDAFSALKSLLAGHEQRLAAVEQTSHTSHTIGQEVIDQIATLAVQTINARLKAALGM